MNTDKNLTFYLNKDQTFEMVFVEGTDENGFMMGGESWNNDSLPVHAVRLSSYWIGKYPVTQGLYEAVMGENPSYFQGDENRPVEQVSWNDIMGESGDGSERGCFMFKLHEALNSHTVNQEALHEAAKILKKKEVKFTLPSEAQWEYSAKGGKEDWRKGYSYSGSNKIYEVAWYAENSHRETKPVGLKKPNGLGIYDMCGNVWEWCMDYYDSEYYKRGNVHPPLLNPVNMVSRSNRVNRGGSWEYDEKVVRLTYRYNGTPTNLNYDLGFRICLA